MLTVTLPLGIWHGEHPDQILVVGLVWLSYLFRYQLLRTACHSYLTCFGVSYFAQLNIALSTTYLPVTLSSSIRLSQLLTYRQLSPARRDHLGVAEREKAVVAQ